MNSKLQSQFQNYPWPRGVLKSAPHYIMILGLSGLFVWLAVSSISGKAPIYDEPIHVAGGYAALKAGDFRIDPENGVLPNMWGALPHCILDSGLKIPDKADPMWREHNRWRLTQKIMFAPSSDHDKIFLLSRMMFIPVALLAALTVYAVSLRLWGARGALVSLGAFSLSPTVLANSGLVKSDMFCALLMLLSAYYFWLIMEKLTIARLLCFISSFSMLWISKMSAPIIIPVLLAILLASSLLRASCHVDIINCRCRIRKWYLRAGLAFLLLAVSSVFSLALIWSAYGFRYSMLPDNNGSYELSILWEKLTEGNKLPEKTVDLLRKHRILPEAYLYGMAYVVKNSRSRDAFLDGKYSNRGWYSFFPLCFVYKTPIPIILLSCIGLASPFICSFKDKSRHSIVFLWRLSLPLSLALIYFLSAVVSNLNIGHRHLIPVYLPLFIIAGGAGLALKKNKWAKSMILILFSALAVENFLIYPHYLSYFSPIAGGPSKGYHRLVDSSLDWGQDLKPLKQWLRANRTDDSKVYISYFGSVDLDAYEMMQKRLLCDLEQVSHSLFRLEPGTYCISATMLQMAYFPDLAQWNEKHERDLQFYQKYFDLLHSASNDPHEVQRLVRQHGRDFWEDSLRNHEKLRFAKLASLLRKRKPDKMIGFSFLVFELSDEDITMFSGKR